MATVIHENMYDMRKSLFVTVIAVCARSLLVCLLVSGLLPEYATYPATRWEHSASLLPKHETANGKMKAQKQICAPHYIRVLWDLKTLRLLLENNKF